MGAEVELAGTVYATRGSQFLTAQHAQGLVQLWAALVLPTLAVGGHEVVGIKEHAL